MQSWCNARQGTLEFIQYLNPVLSSPSVWLATKDGYLAAVASTETSGMPTSDALSRNCTSLCTTKAEANRTSLKVNRVTSLVD